MPFTTDSVRIQCPGWRGCIAEWLTNPWQLFAKHDIQNASATHPGLHPHHARVFRNYFSNHFRITAQGMILHVLQHRIGRIRSYNGQQFSFIRHVQRIESEDFAGTLHGFAHRNPIFVQQHADLRLRCDFVQGSRHAYARRIAHAVDRMVAALIASHRATRIQHAIQQSVQCRARVRWRFQTPGSPAAT